MRVLLTDEEMRTLKKNALDAGVTLEEYVGIVLADVGRADRENNPLNLPPGMELTASGHEFRP